MVTPTARSVAVEWSWDRFGLRQIGNIPVRGLEGKQVYLLAAILAHNLSRELQMQVREPQQSTTENRAPLWSFDRLGTLRRRLIQRAGRLTRPQGILTPDIRRGEAIQHDIESFLERLQPVSVEAISCNVQVSAEVAVCVNTP
ncbi:MAG: hypothetical protein MI919_02075 [Holophagales bacterium]|nr:hypothetical protein [Holophagales bacterium]